MEWDATRSEGERRSEFDGDAQVPAVVAPTCERGMREVVHRKCGTSSLDMTYSVMRIARGIGTQIHVPREHFAEQRAPAALDGDSHALAAPNRTRLLLMWRR